MHINVAIFFVGLLLRKTIDVSVHGKIKEYITIYKNIQTTQRIPFSFLFSVPTQIYLCCDEFIRILIYQFHRTFCLKNCKLQKNRFMYSTLPYIYAFANNKKGDTKVHSINQKRNVEKSSLIPLRLPLFLYFFYPGLLIHKWNFFA